MILKLLKSVTLAVAATQLGGGIQISPASPELSAAALLEDAAEPPCFVSTKRNPNPRYVKCKYVQ